MRDAACTSPNKTKILPVIQPRGVLCRRAYRRGRISTYSASAIPAAVASVLVYTLDRTGKAVRRKNSERETIRTSPAETTVRDTRTNKRVIRDGQSATLLMTRHESHEAIGAAKITTRKTVRSVGSGVPGYSSRP